MYIQQVSFHDQNETRGQLDLHPEDDWISFCGYLFGRIWTNTSLINKIKLLFNEIIIPNCDIYCSYCNCLIIGKKCKWI